MLFEVNMFFSIWCFSKSLINITQKKMKRLVSFRRPSFSNVIRSNPSKVFFSLMNISLWTIWSFDQKSISGETISFFDFERIQFRGEEITSNLIFERNSQISAVARFQMNILTDFESQNTIEKYHNTCVWIEYIIKLYSCFQQLLMLIIILIQCKLN